MHPPDLGLVNGEVQHAVGRAEQPLELRPDVQRLVLQPEEVVQHAVAHQTNAPAPPRRSRGGRLPGRRGRPRAAGAPGRHSRGHAQGERGPIRRREGVAPSQAAGRRLPGRRPPLPDLLLPPAAASALWLQGPSPGVIPEGEQAGQGGRAGTDIWGKSRSPGWNASRGTLDAVNSAPRPPRRAALAPLVLPPESLLCRVGLGQEGGRAGGAQGKRETDGGGLVGSWHPLLGARAPSSSVRTGGSPPRPARLGRSPPRFDHDHDPPRRSSGSKRQLDSGASWIPGPTFRLQGRPWGTWGARDWPSNMKVPA